LAYRLVRVQLCLAQPCSPRDQAQAGGLAFIVTPSSSIDDGEMMDPPARREKSSGGLAMKLGSSHARSGENLGNASLIVMLELSLRSGHRVLEKIILKPTS
jgi:hypothetical protein